MSDINKVISIFNKTKNIIITDFLEKQATETLNNVKLRHGKYPKDIHWQKLRHNTIKYKKGGDTPLLETGELKQSYRKKIHKRGFEVGSNNDKAVWHEYGTVDIPSRPVLRPENKRLQKDIRNKLTDFLKTKLLNIWQ